MMHDHLFFEQQILQSIFIDLKEIIKLLTNLKTDID